MLLVVQMVVFKVSNSLGFPFFLDLILLTATLLTIRVSEKTL